MKLNVPIILAIIPIALFSCQTKTTADKTVSIDQTFQKVFFPDSGGITGADGIFSIPLPDGTSAFLTGDCFLGVVRNGARDISTRMINNSIVIIDREGKTARSVYRGTYDQPESLIEPEQSGDTKHWYWPGHGFTEDSTLYLFALNMYNNPKLAVKSDKPEDQQDVVDKMAENQWSFALEGIDLLQLSLPGMQFRSADRVQCTYDTDIHFGNCVFTEGNIIYIYGTRNDPDGSHIYRARTHTGNRPYHENWEFFDGKEWVTDPHRAVPLKLDIWVSEQFSISRIKDKYVLLTMGKMTSDIYTYTSDSPFQGFKNKTLIYRTPEPGADTTKQLFTYNALAHPQYMKDDELLVSYCINSMTVRDVYRNADNYRARFIRVPLSMIDPTF